MKDEILQTALQQFLKYGIREASIQKLVEPLGISTKTVYKYFKNKEELLEEALLFYYDQQFKVLENISADQKAVSLLFSIWYIGVQRETQVKAVFFQDLHDYYPELEGKIEAIIGKKFTRQFVLIIRKGIKEGNIKQDIRAEVVFEAISVLYTAFVRKGQFKALGLSSYDILLNTIAVMIRGICTNEGVRELDEHIQTVKMSGGIKVFQERMALA